MATNGYRPYTSDSETDSGSESDTSFSSDYTSDYSERVKPQLPNFRMLAQGLSLTNMGGPSGPSTIINALGSPITNGYATFKNYEFDISDPSGEEIKSSSQTINSIIMMDSRDRERHVFPQPTNVTLRLPRV